MKRMMVFFLLAAMLLSASGMAETKYMTMREVHDEVAAQYPDGWQETIQTKWRTVEIHTPVIVPDADKCPVLALQLIEDHPDLAALPGEGWKDETTADGWVRASRSDTEAAPGTKNSEIDAHHFYAPVDLDMVWDGYGGKTLGALLREGGDLLEAACGEKYSWDMEHPFDVMFNTRTRGKETWTTGLSMSAYQTFHGIPYLYSISHYLTYDINKQNVSYPDVLYQISPFGNVHFVYQPVQSEVMEEDIPLCSFEVIKDALRKEIDAGHIRNILEIRFGYTSANRSKDANDSVSVTRPVWQVEVWWCNKGVSEMKPDDPDYPANSRGKRECVRMIFDAQTGELISMAGDALPTQKRIKDIGYFQGYLTWEDVKK